jgi:gamma-tubulin complex component 2
MKPTLICDFKGIDSMMLGYSSTFPISLVLNKRVMTKYQLLFRHLFHCKYIEKLMCMTWLDQCKIRRPRRKASSRPSMSTQLGRRSSAASIKSTTTFNSTAKTLTESVDEDEAFALSQKESVFLTRLSILRGHMLHFVQQFLYFLCFEVIDPNWEKLEKHLSEVISLSLLKLNFSLNMLSISL